jgi:hypothetical protein
MAKKAKPPANPLLPKIRRGGKGTLARMGSDQGHVDLTICWPTRPPKPDGTVPPSGGIGAQRYFVDTNLLPHRYRWMNGGIGSGKTVSGSVFCGQYGLEHPRQTAIIAGASLPAMKKTCIKVFLEELDALAEKNSIPGMYSYNKQDQSVTLFNGFVYYFLGMEQFEKARGITASLIWCDEINTWQNPTGAYNVLLGRLREPSRDGKVFFIVTCSPRGKRGPILRWATNCTHEVAPGVRVGVGDAANHLLITMKTSENTSLDPAYLKELRASYDPQMAKRELDAELVELGRGVFAQCFRQEKWPEGNILHGFKFDKTKYELWIGIDWGSEYPHCLFCAHDPNAGEDDWTDCIFDELCMDGLSEARMFAILHRKLKDLGLTRPHTFVPDKAGKGEIIQLRKSFPGCRIRTIRDDRMDESIRFGTWIVRGRLLNGADQRRLVFAEKLLTQPQNVSANGRGIIRGMIEADYPRDREGRVKQEIYLDESHLVHGLDVTRYLMVVLHPMNQSHLSLS